MGFYTSSKGGELVCISRLDGSKYYSISQGGIRKSNMMLAADFKENGVLNFKPYAITGEFKAGQITWSNGTVYAKISEEEVAAREEHEAAREGSPLIFGGTGKGDRRDTGKGDKSDTGRGDRNGTGKGGKRDTGKGKVYDRSDAFLCRRAAHSALLRLPRSFKGGAKMLLRCNGRGLGERLLVNA